MADLWAQADEPPSDPASPKVKMAYPLPTEPGRESYRLRNCTLEPLIGRIQDVLGFRPVSLRRRLAAAAEWTLVCLPFNLQRWHGLYPEVAVA